MERAVQPERACKHCADRAELPLLVLRQPLGNKVIVKRGEDRGRILDAERGKEAFERILHQRNAACRERENIACRNGKVERLIRGIALRGFGCVKRGIARAVEIRHIFGKAHEEVQLAVRSVPRIVVEHPEFEIQVGAVRRLFVQPDFEVEVCVGVDGERLVLRIQLEEGFAVFRRTRVVGQFPDDVELRLARLGEHRLGIGEAQTDVVGGERRHGSPHEVEQIDEAVRRHIVALGLGRRGNRLSDGERTGKFQTAEVRFREHAGERAVLRGQLHKERIAVSKACKPAADGRAEYDRIDDLGKIDGSEQFGDRLARLHSVGKLLDGCGQRRAADGLIEDSRNAGIDRAERLADGMEIGIDEIDADVSVHDFHAPFVRIDGELLRRTVGGENEIERETEAVRPAYNAVFNRERDFGFPVSEVERAAQRNRFAFQRGRERPEHGRNIRIARIIRRVERERLALTERDGRAERTGKYVAVFHRERYVAEVKVDPELLQKLRTAHKDFAFRLERKNVAPRQREKLHEHFGKVGVPLPAKRGCHKICGVARVELHLRAFQRKIDIFVRAVGKRERLCRAALFVLIGKREASSDREGRKRKFHRAAEGDIPCGIADLRREPVLRKERDERIYKRHQVGVPLGIDGDRRAFRDGKLRAEHVRRDLAVRYAERDVSQRNAAEVDPERFQKLVARKRDFKRVLLFGKGDILRELVGKRRRENFAEVEISERNFRVADKLHDERDRLFGVRFDLDAVEIQIDIFVLIGDADRLARRVLPAAERERQRAVHGKVLLIGKIKVKFPAEHETAALVIDPDRELSAIDEFEHVLNVGNEAHIFAAVRHFGDRLVRIGELHGDVRPAEIERGREIVERDRAVLRDRKAEMHGNGQPHQGKFGIERRAPAVLRHGEIAAAELLQKRVGIQRKSRARPFAFGQETLRKGKDLVDRRLPLDALAVFQIDLLPRILHEYAAELRAQLQVFQIGRVDVDDPRNGRAVYRKIERKIDGSAQNGRERVGKARRRGHAASFGRARRGFIRIVFVIGLVIVGDGFFRAVFVIGGIGSGTADGNAHRRRVFFIDDRLQDLPSTVKGIGDGDLLERGKRRQSAREHHLIDVIGGSLVGGGVEIERLRIRAVSVDDDGIGVKERLLVDDVHREGRAGQAVFRLVVADHHVAVRLAALPLGVDAVIGGRSARRVAPDHAVAHIAELPRRIDHAGRGDVRLNEHAVVILLVGADFLLDHRIDKAVHLGVIVRLPHEASVHVADIFKRAVHIGRRAVIRKFVRDGCKALVHGVGRGALEKERVYAEHAEAENRGNGKARQYLDDTAMIFGFQTKSALLLMNDARTFFVFDRVKPLFYPLLRFFHMPPSRSDREM